MALSARDMILIVRAENQASGALRRVARDVGGLRQLQGLRARGQQLQIVQDRLRAQRQLAQSELTSLTSGSRALALARRRQGAEISLANAKQHALRVDEQIAANQAAQLRNEVQRARYSRIIQRTTNPAVLRDFSKLYDAASISAARLQHQEGRLAEQTGIANSQITKQEAHLKELSAVEADAARRADFLRSRIATQSNAIGLQGAKIAANNKAIRAARWDNVARAGSAIQHTGRVAQYAGLVVGASLALAAKRAADFSSEATLAATQVANKFHDTQQAAADIGNGILKLMAQGRAFADSTTQNAAAYDIFSSMTLRGNQRQQIAQGINLLGQFNKAAIAGQVDLADVTHAGITILNNFSRQGRQVQDLPKLLNRMFASVRYGRTTVTEFVGSLNQVAPAFSTAFGRTPQAFDQLSAAMATLTRQMPSVRMAATGLARLTEMFLRKDFVVGLQKFGVHITDSVGRLKPMNVIIDMLAKRFPKLKTGGQFLANFFKTITAAGSGKAGTTGTIQGRRALQELVLNQKQYHLLSKQVIGDNNEFTKSFRALSDTSGVKWKLFVQQIHAFAIEIGTQAIPAITALGKPLMTAVKWFNSLDDGTKRMIARIGVFGAAIALFGSGLLYVVGTFIRLFALLGRGLGLFGTLTVAVVGISAAVSALSGNWQGLNGIVNTFVSFGTGSLAGWVTMLGLAALAALRFRNALVGARVAAGVGGLFGIVGGARAGASLTREAIKAKGVIGGLAASAALIPGSFAVAAGGMAAVATAALIWKRHMDQVRADAEETARQAKIIATFSALPVRNAQRFGGIAGNVEDVIRARNNVVILKSSLADLQKQFNQAPPGQRSAIHAQISNLKLDIVDAERELGKLSVNANRAFDALATGFQNIGRNALLLRGAKAELASLLTQRKTAVTDNSDIVAAHHNAGILDTQIQRVKDHIKELQSSLEAVPTQFQAQFSKAVRSLQRIGQLPQVRLTADRLKAMFRVDAARGGRLGIPALKAMIDADINPASVKRLGPRLQALVRQYRNQKIQIAAEIRISRQGAAAVRRWLGAAGAGKNVVVAHAQITGAQRAAADAKLKIEKVFSTPVTQHVRVPLPPNLESLGASIAAGIQSGLNRVPVSIHVKEYYDKVVTEFHKQGKIHSPSLLMAEKVGKPLGQGIALGLLQARGDIEKAATLTLDLFQGAWLQAQESALKPKTAKQIAQLKINLDSAINRLSKMKGAGSADVGKLTGAELKYNEALNKSKTSESKLISLHNTLIAAEQRLKNRKGDVRVQTERVALAERKYTDALKHRKLTVGDLTKDLRQQLNSFRQYNRALESLRRRGAPVALLEQLAGLGAEGASKINLLNKMSAPQLKKYIDLWRKAQKEITKSARITQSDVKTALKGLATDAANNLLDIYNNLKTTNVQNFGTLFAGPTNLSNMIGDSFQSALDDYNNQVQDFQNQIKDLNQQIVDAQAQALDQARSDMQQAFGDLFGGNTLADQAKYSFDQLFKDLQAQVTRFDKWRKSLNDIARRVPPGLAQQLEALGPDAQSKLDALNSATDDQLSRYVDLWKQGQSSIEAAARQQVASNTELASQISAIVAQIDTITTQLAALSAPHPLNAQDIINDVQKQLDAWNEYQGTLDSLAKRGIPRELIGQLRDLGPDAEPYLKVLNTMTDAQLNGPGGFVDVWKKSQDAIDTATNKQMQDQLQMWYQHGANIAAAIIAGVATQQDALLNFFKNLFQDLLEGRTPSFNAPPAGSYSGPGSGTGPTAAGQPGAGVSSGLNQGFGGAGGIYIAPGASLMQVDAVHNETLDTTLARATFRLVNRTPG